MPRRARKVPPAAAPPERSAAKDDAARRPGPPDLQARLSGLGSAAGNRALGRLLLDVGRHGPAEEAADRAAAAVTGPRPGDRPAEPDRPEAATATPSGLADLPPGVEERVRDLGPGDPPPPSIRAAMEARTGRGLGDVRLHTDPAAAATADALDARAFSVDGHIAFGPGQYALGTPEGRGLVAHELAHAAQQRTAGGQAATVVQRKTKGEEVVERARRYLTEEADLKTEVDVLKAALREIKGGKSVGFNEQAGLGRIDNAGRVLGLDAARVTALKTDWRWLVANRAQSGSAGYRHREQAFFGAMGSRLQALRVAFPGAQTHDRLRYAPARVVDLMVKVSDAEMPAEHLFTYAYNEGLSDYVLDALGLPEGQVPTESQLAGVSTSLPVEGFDLLGLDDFMTDLSARRQPLSGILPSTFDVTRLTPVTRTNERGRVVHTAVFPDLESGLQGMVAMLKRRRRLFLEDATSLGYGAPTEEELVYWTYVYYNPGEFGAKASLTRHRGRRSLSTWITRGEYPHAQKVLQSFRMLRAMGLF